MKRLKDILNKWFGLAWVSAVGKAEERLADAYNWEDEETELVPWIHKIDGQTGQILCTDDPWLLHPSKYTQYDGKVTCPGCREVLKAEQEAQAPETVHAYNARQGTYYCGVDYKPGGNMTSIRRSVTCPGCKWVLLNPAERN